LVIGKNLMCSNNILKWVATVITLLGSLCVALSIDPLNVILLNIGAAMFIVWGFRIKENAIVVVNTGLLAIYIFGLMLRI
jgi:Flp pilus assembly CpaF family ATPase